jgi:hypothetical protein
MSKFFENVRSAISNGLSVFNSWPCNVRLGVALVGVFVITSFVSCNVGRMQGHRDGRLFEKNHQERMENAPFRSSDSVE